MNSHNSLRSTLNFAYDSDGILTSLFSILEVDRVSLCSQTGKQAETVHSRDKELQFLVLIGQKGGGREGLNTAGNGVSVIKAGEEDDAIFE